MKHALAALLLALLALVPNAQAQKSQVDLRERLSEATLLFMLGSKRVSMLRLEHSSGLCLCGRVRSKRILHAQPPL
jgi:hypothetical protein